MRIRFHALTIALALALMASMAQAIPVLQIYVEGAILARRLIEVSMDTEETVCHNPVNKLYMRL